MKNPEIMDKLETNSVANLDVIEKIKVNHLDRVIFATVPPPVDKKPPRKLFNPIDARCAEVLNV